MRGPRRGEGRSGRSAAGSHAGGSRRGQQLPEALQEEIRAALPATRASTHPESLEAPASLADAAFDRVQPSTRAGALRGWLPRRTGGAERMRPNRAARRQRVLTRVPITCSWLSRRPPVDEKRRLTGPLAFPFHSTPHPGPTRSLDRSRCRNRRRRAALIAWGMSNGHLCFDASVQLPTHPPYPAHWARGGAGDGSCAPARGGRPTADPDRSGRRRQDPAGACRRRGRRRSLCGWRDLGGPGAALRSDPTAKHGCECPRQRAGEQRTGRGADRPAPAVAPDPAAARQLRAPP